MNARLINATPESLSAHAETYSRYCQLMLESGEQWSELHFGALRNKLDRTRSQWAAIEQAIEQEKGVETWFKHCAESFGHSMEEAVSTLRQASRLSAESRTQLRELMDSNWEQSKTLYRHLAQEQLAMLRKVGSAFAGTGEAA